MNDRPVILVVSDLHMGGGAADTGDDFVHRGAQFERFVDQQLQTPEGQAGRLELIFNGDTFELAQVRPEVYTLASARLWCSKDESLEKLDFVLAGHRGIFEALRRFAEAGNAVTFAAGNHDVELYWDEVQEQIRALVPGARFEIGTEWYTRHAGRLAISHGHMLDPANRFEHWSMPILPGPDGDRLEMCPGTLFMVKFVNWLERQYPFADNLHPVTSLADILIKDRLSGLAPVAWMFSRFVVRHPTAALEEAPEGDYGGRLHRELADDPVRFEQFAAAYRAAVDPGLTDEALRARLDAPDGVADVLLDLMAALPLAEWLGLTSLPPSTLSLDDPEGGSGTLSIWQSGRQEADQVLRQEAGEKIEAGASVVVMGHTHQPDRLTTGQGQYFNPGSWTRYIDAARIGMLTLEDLKNEETFPYQLNYVRIEADASGTLTAKMVTFEERTGFRFGQRLNLMS